MVAIPRKTSILAVDRTTTSAAVSQRRLRRRDGSLSSVFASILAAIVSVASVRCSAATRKPCSIQDMSLRYGSMPIDVEPSFRPYIFSYVATLAFSMDSFSVSARPDTGCDVDGTPPEPVHVQIGGTAKLRLYARDQETQERQPYDVTLNRLLGSETDLQLLRVEKGAISPVFDPAVRSYTVRLDISSDEARIVYKLRDNEQRIRSATTREGPTDASSAARLLQALEAEGVPRLVEDETSSRDLVISDGAAEAGPPRRLGSEATTGEVQFREDHALFMLDVGFSRVITLTVQCADATQANIGTYEIAVSRPRCKPEKPYFDPMKRMCVNYCQSGFYKNSEALRCSRCNTYCLVCRSLVACQMCRPNTADFEYVVQSDGSCRRYENHIFKKYRWWSIGWGAFLVFLVLLGCAGLCQACCIGSGSKPKHQKLRTYDSDSEEELTTTNYAARRRLGMY
eukprot:TRINITY_DN62328_c0_g1_i1.p1 TRINITY_DN62328_c0_g1~~TRINITY_DN62328_c0_g1_i1.p1  ORF type:complete len:455 (+),score=59.47 TRINITY_DN62328_c0_g1_i1:307-1671(+)